MLKKKIDQIRAGLFTEECGIPKNALKAYADLLPKLRFITSQYLPNTSTMDDIDDAESDALENGLRYIRAVMKKDPFSTEWTKQEWSKRLYSRFQNAVLESAKYLLSPIKLPRPLRFSMKKYVDILSILRKYIKETNIVNSDLYKAVFECYCSLTNYKTCPYLEICKTCHIQELDSEDLYEIQQMLVGDRKSIMYYAKLYRKTYKDWIGMLESVKEYVVRNDLPQEDRVDYDLDKLLTFKHFRECLNAIHPDLFEIYCFAISDTDTERLNSNLEIFTPRGWLGKDIKDKFNLTKDDLMTLLESGDEVLNKFRTNEGLQPIQRRLWSEFTV
jgi:hypothetical protein